MPIPLTEAQVSQLFDEVAQQPGYELEVDLAQQLVITPSGDRFPFEVDASRKHSLLQGLDEIGQTLQKADLIREFEAKRLAEHPWLVAQPK